MNRHLAFRLGCVATIIALLVALWNFRSSREAAMPSRSSPANSAVSPFSAAHSAPSRASTFRRAEANAHERDALPSLLAMRLREWSDDDDPEKREARTAELEQFFFGRGEKAEEQLAVLELVPVDLRDFAFGLPSFQKWMFAHPAAALAWMSEHAEISEARVLTALQEVENALIAFDKEWEHSKALNDAVVANRKAVDLSMQLYTQGQTDFLSVLEVRRLICCVRGLA